MWKYYLKRESCCSGATALNYKYELLNILSSYLPFHWNLFFVFCFLGFFFAKVEFTIHGRLTTELGQLFHPFLKPCPLQWDFALLLMRKRFLSLESGLAIAFLCPTEYNASDVVLLANVSLTKG